MEKVPVIIDHIFKETNFNNMTEAIDVLPSMLMDLMEQKKEFKQGYNLNNYEITFLWCLGAETYQNQHSTGKLNTSFYPEYPQDIEFAKFFQNSGEVAFSLGYIRQRLLNNQQLPLVAIEVANSAGVKLFPSQIIKDEYSEEMQLHFALCNGWKVDVHSKQCLVCYDHKDCKNSPIFEAIPLVGKYDDCIHYNSFAVDQLKLKLTTNYILNAVKGENEDKTLIYNKKFGIIHEALVDGKYLAKYAPLEKFFNNLRRDNNCFEENPPKAKKSPFSFLFG